MSEITEKQYQERIVALNREVMRLTALVGTTSYKSAYESQRVLTAERECKILELRQEIQRLTGRIKYLESRYNAIRDDKLAWWSQPWYKRVWSALRGVK